MLWIHSGDAGGGDTFVGYCPDGENRDGSWGSWHHHCSNKFPGRADHNAMQLLPELDLLIVAVHASDALYAIAPSAPERPPVHLVSSGDKPVLRPYASLQHAANAHCLVYFSPQDAGDLFAVTPANGAWDWRRIKPELQSRNLIKDAARRRATPSTRRTHSAGFGSHRSGQSTWPFWFATSTVRCT
jgi:hypothetical protein